MDDSVVNRPQQYLSPIEDFRPLVLALILSTAALFVVAFSPVNVPLIAMRIFLGIAMSGMIVFVFSRGHRVLRAVQTGRVESPGALFVPLRAIVIDPRANGGTYCEDGFLRVLPDGTLVWRRIDADMVHTILADQITDVRIEQSVRHLTYPHILVVERDGREHQFHLMKPRPPVWRVGATPVETEGVAHEIRERIARAEGAPRRSLINLGYAIHSDSDLAKVVWYEIDAMSLSYDCFLGDIIFTVDDADLSAKWGWIPVLDFALIMRKIGDDLANGEDSVFDFTDSGLTIDFHVDGDHVEIRAEYAPDNARIAIEEFRWAAESMLDRVRRQIEVAHPELLRNEHYRKMVGVYR